jgi:predicted transposase YdaD
LRPEADAYHNLTGQREYRDEADGLELFFAYSVIRVWELPVEQVLRASPALLPLALLSDLSGASPESVVHRIEERLTAETPRETASLLWTATYIMAGMTYAAEDIERLLSGVLNMKESSTYQKILAEGEAKGEALGRLHEAQNMLLLVGQGSLGKPDASVTRRIRAIKSVDRLEAMAQRLLTVQSWADLLG